LKLAKARGSGYLYTMPTAIEIIGYIAAFCTTASFLPQAIVTIKTKNTKGLSLGMYSLFSLGVFMWLLYGLFIGDKAIIVSNFITTGLAITILSYKIKYDVLKK
jgi:MtN3 and saliva related transmembrane protein